MPKVQLIETRDGSSSLLLPEMNETYHSTHGAVTESKYVFVKMGLLHWLSLNPDAAETRILEVGFGTGLNTWLTLTEVEAHKNVYVQFTSLEKFPLDANIISQLNYTRESDNIDRSLFNNIHNAKWNEIHNITDRFELLKWKGDIADFPTHQDKFDIIYFDAFAPSRQPEMWSPEVLTKMYQLLNSGGIFVTYCAQGQFKRDLKSAGFDLEELPGPPGKKEMTRGIKPPIA